MKLDRITVDPARMGGEPCIRDLRMPVATIVKLIADGWSEQQILADWPDLEKEDIKQALRFASQASRMRVMPVDG